MTIDINELTFGVEIETTIPQGMIRVGPHGAGYDIAQVPGWKADCDPSIRASHGREACEFVSPVYKGTEGLRQLVADLSSIKALGAKVNRSCGLHIHVGFDHGDRAAVARLTTLVSNFEKAIYAATGTKTRERSRWCAGLNRHRQVETAIQASSHNRYHVLNLATRKPTVEFRAFAGSLNQHRVIGYVRLCAGLVERALRAVKMTNWTAKVPVNSSPIHRDGEGQTALTRLFYQLGWTKGRQAHVHGALVAAGLSPMNRSKKELMKLAKKYDAQR